MTEANDIYRYDVFISYSHYDGEWAQGWLLPRLEAAGLRVCIDFRDFEPGLPSLVNMENAVERSGKTLIVLTPAWVESQWAAFESLLIQTDDPAGRRARMIPLLLKPCDLPRRIAMLTYLDFTQRAQDEFQLQRLISAIKGAPSSDIGSGRDPGQEVTREVTVEIFGRRVFRIFERLETQHKVAIIVALIAFVGAVLGGPAVGEIVKIWLNRPTSTPVVPVTMSPSPTTTATATPTPTPRSTTVDEYPFYVYRDNGSSDNHFSFWEGIMGDGESIGWGSQIDYGYSNNCHSGSTCMRIVYTPVSPKAYWVGISWQHPQGNWAAINEGFDLEKATRLTFWARGEKGGEPVTFGMGGLGRDAKTCVPDAPYPDSVCPPVEASPLLSTTWQQYSIDLVGKDLSHVIMGFLIAIGGGDAHTIYLDEIKYESGPQATMPPTATATPTSSPTPTITPTSTPTSTPTATPLCPVTAATDEETIRALVLAEAERVLQQDLEGVIALFDENALKWDKARNQSWQGRAQIRQYYEEAWRYIQYKQVLHTNIEVTVTGATARARNDSLGTYIVRATGAEERWNNPRGDSWTFVRGIDGCWLITGHRFNLSPEDP